MQKKNKLIDQFIPFYPEVAIKYNLTPVETLIFGYVRFFTAKGGKFYMSNPELAKRLNCTLVKVKRSITSLQAKKLIKITTKKELGNKRSICVPSAHSEPTPRLIVSLPSAHSEPSPPPEFAHSVDLNPRFFDPEKKSIEEEIKIKNKKNQIFAIPDELIFFKIKLTNTCKFKNFNPTENDLIKIRELINHQEIWFKILRREFEDQNQLINFLTKINNE